MGFTLGHQTIAVDSENRPYCVMARRVSRWAKRALWAFGGLLAISAFGLLLILQVWPVDHFRFLGGREALIAGQMSPIEVDDFQNPGRHVPADEYRIYSWKQDFNEVKSEAAAELAALGYGAVTRPGLSADHASWSRFDGRSVWLQLGRSQSRRDALGGYAKPDRAWVTVICGNPAPDNWITHVRIAFEPSDW